MKKFHLSRLRLALIILLLAVLGWGLTTHKSSPGNTAATKNEVSYPTDEAASLWAVVNKGRQLPAAYVPQGLVAPSVPLALDASNAQMQLRSDAAAALQQLVAAGEQQDIHLMLASGYRSYAVQVITYDSEVSAYGTAKADAESARPGHSEHQTGLAADLEPTSRQCAVQDCFADTPEG
jgi:D-alanyl-D-alanine carboxypeptidase